MKYTVVRYMHACIGETHACMHMVSTRMHAYGEIHARMHAYGEIRAHMHMV